jgi:hypothetical protein
MCTTVQYGTHRYEDEKSKTKHEKHLGKTSIGIIRHATTEEELAIATGKMEKGVLKVMGSN